MSHHHRRYTLNAAYVAELKEMIGATLFQLTAHVDKIKVCTVFYPHVGCPNVLMRVSGPSPPLRDLSSLFTTNLASGPRALSPLPNS